MFNDTFFQNFIAISTIEAVGFLVLLFACFFVLKKLQDREIGFSLRMSVALIFGVSIGSIIQYTSSLSPQDSTLWLSQVQNWYSFFGNIFISLIKMIIVPIVLVSMIRSIINIDSNINIKSIFSRTIFWLLLTVTIAAIVGIALAVFANIGEHSTTIQSAQIKEVKSITSVFLALIPSNILSSMLHTNVVGLIILALFVGFSTRALKDEIPRQINTFSDFIEASYRIIMSITLMIIRLMPYAIVALMAKTIASNGFDIIKQAGAFIIIVYIATLVMVVIYMILVALHGLNPITFVKKSLSVWIMAFSSRSSVGTMPFTISTLQERLGVSQTSANIVSSLGATIGLNGCAGYFPAMAAVFVAHIVGIDVNFSFMLLIVMVAILGSLGIAGIPGIATMAASIMLEGVGLGSHFGLLSIILAIDPIIDMARTMTNVAGAMTCAICVDKENKTLNKEVFNS